MKKLNLINNDEDGKSLELLARYLKLTHLQGVELDEHTSIEKDWSELVKFSKTYPRFDKIKLQKIQSRKTYPFLNKRKSIRKFDKSYTLNTQDISKIFSNSAIDLSNSEYPKRLFPSGGAMYPTNIYLLNLKESDLAKGLYYYNPKKHWLELLFKDYDNNETNKIICDEDISNPSALVILTSSYFKHCLKYGGRGFRYSLIEIGALAQLIDISCRDAGLDCVWLGAFNDDYVKKLLDINDELELELPVLIIAIGKNGK